MPLRLFHLPFMAISAIALILATCGSPVSNPGGTPVDTVSPATLAPTPTQFVPPAATSSGDSANALAGSQWQLSTINGATLANAADQPKPVTLNFGDDGQATGIGGCNAYGGGYQVQGDAVTFQLIVSTKMACVDEGVMQQENQFFQILQSATKFSLTPEQLTIMGQGSDVLVFTNAAVP